MTNYLELLEAWQQADENEPFVWKTAAAGRRAMRAEDKVTQAAGREAVGAEPDGGQERKERVWAGEAPTENRGADTETRLATLERAVARGRAGQAARGWSRERTESAQAADGGQSMQRLTAATPGVQRGLAGWLDAAFERDARRYDGPLGLF